VFAIREEIAVGGGRSRLRTQAFVASAFLKESPSVSPQAWLAATLEAALAVLFFFAGRALSRSGAKAGARWPWIGLALVFSVPFFFVRPYVTPTGSMENTLLIGDHVLVQVFPQPGIERGALRVFHYPVDRKQIFVKRVIGVAGDRIRIKDRVVYLNGALLTEPYVIRRFPAEENRDNLPSRSDDRAAESIPGLLAAKQEMLQNHVANGEVIVPKGHYFVLGDNRDNSLDSWYWGFVDESDVIGKPFLIYYSEAGTVPELGRGTNGRGMHLRWGRLFKLL
jgi:signal peptidase I